MGIRSDQIRSDRPSGGLDIRREAWLPRGRGLKVAGPGCLDVVARRRGTTSASPNCASFSVMA